MVSDKQLAHLRRIASLGGKARAAMPDFHDHQVKAGKLGWAATCKKYGPQVAARHLRQYRLDNPSSGEAAVAEILTNNEIAYSREEYIEGIGYVDFLVENLVIEVEGGIHRRPEFFGERDEETRYQVLRNRGYQVLVIDDRDINEQQILEVLDDTGPVDF